MKKKFYDLFDFTIFDWSTWVYVIVNVFFFGNLFLNKRMVFEGKATWLISVLIIADIIYLVYIFYQYFKEQYVRSKVRKLRFAMKNGGFSDAVVEELTDIFKRYPINPYHIDIGETQAQVADWAVHTIVGHHPYIIEKSFYNIKDAKERERYRKLLRHFDVDLFFIARDTYIDLVEGDHYKSQFEEGLEWTTHGAMKEISKMVTRLFND